MININNKDWDELKSLDIRKFLERNGEENFFFEFKSDNEKPSELMKEICAFANTYGGYILLGIDDDKSISGCKKWTEQRIHATIHDSITPPPIFSVRSFNLSRKKIYIIKIGIDQVKYLPKRAITPEDCIFINHCLETQLKEKFKREGVR